MPQNLGTNYKSSFEKMKVISKTDIYIKPDIKDFGISFDKGKEIIVKGKKLHLQCMKNRSISWGFR
jgi:hypothetical protein